MSNDTDANKPAEISPAATPPEKKQGRVHLVAIDGLIVHKYAGSEALLRKADKIAREIIDGDLREGEFLQVMRPGRYHLHLPKMRPDAGALRCATLLAQIERAIRHVNPTSFQMHEAEEGTPPPSKESSANDAAPTPKPKSRAATAEAEEIEKRKAASEAVKMMIGVAVQSREEVLGSQLGRILDAEIELKALPVWNVRNKLISAHECTPVRHGAMLSKDKPAFRKLEAEPVEIRATIDTLVYGRVSTQLKRNLSEQSKMLQICPVHASTLESKRYISAFLESGAEIPSAGQKYLVFLVMGCTASVSKMRLRDLVQYLRPRCRGLIADMPIGSGDFGIFKELGFHGVRTNTPVGGASEKRVLDAMNAFVNSCESAKLESFVSGIRTRSLALGALASGCTYLSGSVITKRSARGGSVETFEIDTLFS